MINNKLAFLNCCFIILTAVCSAQTKPLLLEDCYTLAKQNYPLVKQRELITKSSEYAVINVSKGYLPQLAVNGQATYQSDVTQLPIKLPGVDIPTLSKDQYRVYLDVNQVVYDGGFIESQKKLQQANGIVEEQRLEVELYKLKDRVNQLFFGILLMDEQLVQNNLLKKDIQHGVDKAQAYVSNGTAFKSSVDVLKAEKLRAEQHTIQLKAMRKAYITMLALFINIPLDENTILVKPKNLIITEEIKRPELIMYDYQAAIAETQYDLLKAKNKPKLNFFLQGGYGRPAFNILSNSFDPYYIGGLRLNIPLTGLYTFNKEHALIAINKKSIEIQKENFLFNTQFNLKQQTIEISKLQEILLTDDEIIALRISIKNTASAQLANGVINSNDYLRELNAEDNAKQNKILHEIQLLIAQYNQQTTTGN